LYKSNLCNKMVIKYALVEPKLPLILVFAQRWSLYRGGLWKVVINQKFHPNIHVHQDLIVSVFHFPFPLFPNALLTAYSQFWSGNWKRQKRKMESGNGNG